MAVPAAQWEQIQDARRARGDAGWRAAVPPPPPATSFGRLWQFGHRAYRSLFALAFAAVALLAAVRLAVNGAWDDALLTCGLVGLAGWFGARSVLREAERAGLRGAGARRGDDDRSESEADA